MSVKPAITLLGGKSKLAARIISHFPPHHTYVELFAGTAAVLLAKPPAKVELINDIDGDLVNLYRVLRDPLLSKRLKDACDSTLCSRAEFDLAKAPADDPLERARRFMVRQRMSYGGMGEQWSWSVSDSRLGMANSVRRWQAGAERFDSIHKRLRRVQIEQSDWRILLSRYDSPRTLFYLDPPYIPATRIGGSYSYELSQDDHEDIVARLLGIEGMAVISGYVHEAYEPLEAAGWVKHSFNLPAFTSDKRTRRSECLWISPSIEAAKAAAPNPMRLGALLTHKSRVASTELKLKSAIRRIQSAGRRVTVTAVARTAGLSRGHVSRRYHHLLPA